MLHNAASGVPGISSALHSILFLLTSYSFEIEYRKGIQKNGHNNQKEDCVFSAKGLSVAATKLFGNIMDSLNDSSAS